MVLPRLGASSGPSQKEQLEDRTSKADESGNWRSRNGGSEITPVAENEKTKNSKIDKIQKHGPSVSDSIYSPSVSPSNSVSPPNINKKQVHWKDEANAQSPSGPVISHDIPEIPYVDVPDVTYAPTQAEKQRDEVQS